MKKVPVSIFSLAYPVVYATSDCGTVLTGKLWGGRIPIKSYFPPIKIYRPPHQDSGVSCDKNSVPPPTKKSV